MKKINKSLYFFALTGAIFMSSCKKDYPVITGAANIDVFSSTKGIMGVAVGIQRTYSLNVLYGIADANGLLTNETFLVNPGNASELQFSNGGGAVDNTNALLTNVWATSCKSIYDANNIINASPVIADKGYASGVVAYASLIKASAIGTLSTYWEKIPDTIGLGLAGGTTGFIPRAQGFARAIAAINKGQAAIAANPMSSAFLADLPAGMDIINSLNALAARYKLFVGDYAGAIANAAAVDVSKAPSYNFDVATPNPIFQSVTSTNNVYQPVDSTLGLPLSLRPAVTDARIPFYTSINTTAAPRFRLNGFWNAALKPIPVYVTDEMRLITAECLLRQATPNPAGAQAILDAILKQAPAADVNGIGANIAAGYTGASDVASLLDEVYRNRCIELYLSGLKLEDMRRFGRPITERKRNFLPYPVSERNNNINTPPDPLF